MDDRDDIEADVPERGTTYDDFIDPPEAPEPDAVVVGEPSRPRPKWPFILLLGALLGFGASFAASYLTRPEPFDASALQREVAALKTQVGELRSRSAPAANLGPLERRVAALEARETGAVPDTEPLQRRLASLSERVGALEEADPPVIDEALVARLEKLRADGLTSAPPPDLSKLTRRVDALEARPQRPVKAPTVDLAPLETRIAALEARAETPAAAKRVAVRYPPFPSDTLRDAAEARRGGLLSKHIRVRSDDDPLSLIDGIEADLKAGRGRAALAKFDRLPEPMRNLARGWRADMQTALEGR